MIAHWNSWNEYHSHVLNACNSDMSVILITVAIEVYAISLRDCTTITQIVLRLFALPYSSLDDGTYVSIVPNYNLTTRNHITYSHNLCTHGTVMANNVKCQGNLATMPLLRTDRHGGSLIHIKKKSCPMDFKFSGRVN